MKSSAQTFLFLIEPGTRRRWLLLVCLAVLGSAIEAGGALLTVVLLTAINGDGGVDVPVADFLGGSAGDAHALYGFLAFTATFFVARAVFIVAQTYLQHRIAANAGVRLSARLQQAYLRMPYDLYVQHNSAEMIRTAQLSVEGVVRHSFIPALTLIADAALVAGITIVLLVVQPAATLAAALGLALIVIPVQRFVRPHLQRLGAAAEAAAKNALQALQQSLQGAREVRLSGNSQQFEQQYVRHRTAFTRAYYRQSTFEAVPRVSIETGFILVVLLLLFAAVARGGDLTEVLSVLGLFAYAVLRVLPALNRIVSAVNSLKYGAAALENVRHDLDSMSSRGQGASRTLNAGGLAGESAARTRLQRDLELRGVTYKYPGTDAPALTDVSFHVRRGETVGVVGTTGSGKSTLVDVVLGLLVPSSGRVLVDGRDIAEDLSAWHASVGVVPQNVFLLDDTLRRNIAFGLPDSEISDERLLACVRAARLDAWLASLPSGLETMVGERGVRMSGGQRQRVAIARALYREPDLLVLDEGTSALDNLTEAEIIRELADLRGSVTMLIVAHRLSTVRDCDRILLVEGGVLVDAAPYELLIDRHESFRRMAL